MPQEKAAATIIEEPVSQTAVDEAIASIEKLYETLAGSPPPGGQTSTPIPVERNPTDFVTERLEHLLRALDQPLAAVGWTWTPPMIVWENARETLVCLDLPGVRRTEVEIANEGGVLTVSGQRRAVFDGYRMQLGERPLGPFRRQVLLPRNARASELRAKLQDGVLEIRIPKETAGAAARKIEIT